MESDLDLTTFESLLKKLNLLDRIAKHLRKTGNPQCIKDAEAAEAILQLADAEEIDKGLDLLRERYA